MSHIGYVSFIIVFLILTCCGFIGPIEYVSLTILFLILTCCDLLSIFDAVLCAIVVTIFFFACWLKQKREQRKVVSGILDYAGAYRPLKLRWELRRIPNALELCEKWGVYVPEWDGGHVLYNEHKDTECCVCGSRAVATELVKFLDSPLIYGWLKKHNMGVWCLRGLESPQPFCSRECYASFELWNLFIPTNKTEWLRRCLLIVEWKMKRIVRRVFG